MLEQNEYENGIRELRLARAPVNALNPELVAMLKRAVTQAQHDGVQALMISGSPGLFSAGLDIPALLQLDRNAMGAFWNDLLGLCAVLARSPIPIAAAVTGHSPAGGAVLAIFCDYRVMARGEFRIGLNEVQVGLTVPDCIQAGLRRLVGAYRAERMLIAGEMVDPERALEIGMVDALVDVDAVTKHVLAWLTELLKLPRHAMLATRSLARADLARVFDEPANLSVDTFLDSWFASEAQTTMHELVERLHSKNKS